MAEPVTEQAVQAIITALQGMTGDRGGWTYPAGPVVERQWKAMPQIAQFPHLVVRPISGTTMEQAETAGGMAGYWCRFRFLVTGFVIGDAGAEADTWLERLWRDVVGTLAAHATLDGLASDITLDGERLVDDESAFTRGAVFAQPFVAKLWESLAVA